MSRPISPPSSVEYVLLGLLSGQPCHGYELHKQFNQLCGVGLVWNIKQANLYALLEKLERKGLIRASLRAEAPHLAKKEYSLTVAGRKAFEVWRSAPVRRARDMRQDFLARLYFARFTGPEAVSDLILAQKAICQNWLARLEQQRESLTNEQAYEQAVCLFRIEQVRAMQSWLNDLQVSSSSLKQL